MAASLDISLSTPVTRKGPTSRVLQRRSMMPEDERSPRSNVATPNITAFSRTADAFSRSVLQQSQFIDVTRPLYAYQARNSLISAKSSGEELITATENLFVDFMSSSTGPKEGLSDVLDQIAEFEQILDDHVSTIQAAIAKSESMREGGNLDKLKQTLKLERNTWRLVGKMLALSGEQDIEMGQLDGPITEKTVIESLFNRNMILTRAQAIVDWLELNARDDIDEAETETAYGQALVGWENTLHTLVLGGRGQHGLLITELDPDAKRRTGKRLHEIDERDEERFLKKLYLLIRAGMLKRAQDLCVEMGQPWRAATLLGWQLYHDPNLGNKSEVDILPPMGNPRRDLWKKTAWNLSQDPKVSSFERAIYSTFCGNAGQLLANVCRSWEDMVWALCKSMVDVLVERELRSSLPKEYTEMPELYWDNKTELMEIIQSMQNSSNKKIRDEASSPFRIQQSHIILGNWEKLAQAMTECSETDNPHLLRFLSHLVLVLEQTLKNDDGKVMGALAETKEQVLERYIAYLIFSGRVQQVAWYTSHLNPEAQVRVYSAFMETVEHDDDRQMCLRLGLECELPMSKIRYTVVDKILNEICDSEEESEESDSRKISALDWLLIEPCEIVFALMKSNALLRFFIADHKVDKARIVLQKVRSILDADDIPEEDFMELRCLELYIQMKESFNDWFEFYHKGQPVEPPAMSNADTSLLKNDYTAKLAWEQKNKQYQDSLKRWKNTLVLQSHEVTERLEAILTFPGGWLSFQDDDEDKDDEHDIRLKELKYLRRTCIVESAFLMHRILHSTEQFKEAVQISDIIASEKYSLYSLFSQEDMRAFLGKIRESSVELLDRRRDAWGYKK